VLAPFIGRSITRIEWQGNRTTRDFVIAREVRSIVGQPLRLKTALEDIRRLDNLDIFSAITLEARAEAKGVALVFRVRELPAVVPYISYKVTDEDGWSFGPAVRSVNLLGRDLFVAGFALFGGNKIFLLDLTDPWMAADHLSLELDIERIERRNELDGFDETTFTLKPWFGLYLGEYGRLRGGVSYMRVRSDTPGHILSAGGSDDLFSVGAALGYDSRDFLGNPRRGWFNEIEVNRSGGPLPGDGNFWTAHFDVRRFQPVITNHTLAIGSLLSLQSGQLGRDLPEYMDYHLGGANTIRGYNVKELGLRLHGRNQWLASAEYRFSLLEPHYLTILGLSADVGLDGVLFADTGLAWTGRQTFKAGRFNSGAGVGLHLLVPAVDMVRLGVGFTEGGDWRIHLASFSKFRSQRFRRR